MNSQKCGSNEGRKDPEDADVDDASDTTTVSGHTLTNGDLDSPDCLSRVHSGDSLEDRSADNCDSSGESAFYDKTENASSQAFGGARPKTTRSQDKTRVKNGDSSRTRNSDNGDRLQS